MPTVEECALGKSSWHHGPKSGRSEVIAVHYVSKVSFRCHQTKRHARYDDRPTRQSNPPTSQQQGRSAPHQHPHPFIDYY